MSQAAALAILGQQLAGPLGVERWTPWVDPESGDAPQRQFLAASRDSTGPVVYQGGNRSGKTTVLCAEAAHVLFGTHRWIRRPAPRSLWLVGLDWEWGVGEVLWPTIKPFVDWSRVCSVVWWRKGEPEIPRAIVTDDGSKLEFKSADSGREKFQGAPKDWIGLDEETPGDVVEECEARLLDRAGYLRVAATPLKRSRWLVDLTRRPDVTVVRASMRAAARAGLLDLQRVESFLASLPARTRAVREFGDFAALEGLVYPEFNRITHVLRPSGDWLLNGEGAKVAPWPLPRTWPRFAAMDFGYSHPAAVPSLVHHLGTDTLILDLCPYAPHVRVSTWAKVIRDVIPPLSRAIVCDHDSQAQGELRAGGVWTRPADKEVPIPVGLEVVGMRLMLRGSGHPGLYLVVHDETPPTHPSTGRIDAHAVAWEMEAYRYPAARSETQAQPKDLPLKRDDHAMDALRYLLTEVDRGVVSLLLRRGGADAGPPERALGEEERSPETPVQRIAPRVVRSKDRDRWQGF